LLGAAGSSKPRLAVGSAGGAALIIRNGICDIGPQDHEINGWRVTHISDGVSHQVTTPSGNILLTCRGRLPETAAKPARAATLETGPDQQFQCWSAESPAGEHAKVGSGRQTWSPSGNIIATCEVSRD
jgi:hypothetical protein